MEEKYYKIIAADGKSPTTRFDYTPYLPRGGEAGEWLPKIPDNKLESDGYYVSKYWNMWYSPDARIYEVEVRNIQKPTIAGVEKQACCSQIRLLRDATEELLATLPQPAPAENFTNTGVSNTGLHNTGNFNTGNYNTGNRNTGALNSGDFNTGDNNTGIDNVGDGNVGTGNVGCYNIGHSNTGSHNKGSYNSGDYNTGFANSGSFNKGNRNAGKWNIGSRHSGFFNTEEPPAIMFNKPTNKKLSEIKLPKWLNRPHPKKEFKKITKEEAEETLKLPNFDYKIFEQITGITESDFKEKLC